MTSDSLQVRAEGWATRLAVPLGVITVMVAAVALVVAGVHVADTFGSGAGAAELARDRGVGAATPLWATPLALAGIATIFTGIAVALAWIRHGIRDRRDALVTALPRVLSIR